MTMMVRQLAPTANGLPLEIYAFTSTVKWIDYEHIMADIFDHVIAAATFFDLQIYETEASGDQTNIRFNDPIYIERHRPSQINTKWPSEKFRRPFRYHQSRVI